MLNCRLAESMLSVYKTPNEASSDYESTQFFLFPKRERKRQVQFLSCTTITVYENLSKNSFFLASELAYSPQWRSSFLVCGCKGTPIFRTGQTFPQLFSKKMHIFMFNGIKTAKKGMDTLLYITREGN